MDSPPDPKAYAEIVWNIVRQIPPGVVTTYGQVASMIPAPAGVAPEDYARLAPVVELNGGRACLSFFIEDLQADVIAVDALGVPAVKLVFDVHPPEEGLDSSLLIYNGCLQCLLRLGHRDPLNEWRCDFLRSQVNT